MVVNCYVNFNMPSPSLHVHYKHFNTTTTRSAPYISTTSMLSASPVSWRVLQNDTEFTCSLKQPKYMSCQLNPGCRVSSSQVSDTLSHGYKRNYPFLTSPFALTRLHHWFILIQLIVFTPTGILIPVFLCRSPHHSFLIVQHKVV
jgi:hypothetical protein